MKAFLHTLADVDAETYFTAIKNNGGTVSPMTRDAVATFVKSGKANGWWSAVVDCGLFVGDQIASAMVKLKGSPTVMTNHLTTYSASGGVVGNGVTDLTYPPTTTGYIDTGYNFSTAMANGNNGHIAIYTKDAYDQRPIGMSRFSVFTNHFLPVMADSGQGFCWGNRGPHLAAPANVPLAGGFRLATRSTSGQAIQYRRKFQNIFLTTDNSSPTNLNNVICSSLSASDQTGTGAKQMGTSSLSHICFYSIGTYLSPTLAVAFANDVETLQAALGRSALTSTLAVPAGLASSFVDYQGFTITPGAVSGATNYLAYYSTTSGGPYQYYGYGPSSVGFSGLAPSTNYYVVLTATNASGIESRESAQFTVTTAALPPAPIAPVGLSLSEDGDRTTVIAAWTANITSVITSTQIYESLNGGAYNLIDTVGQVNSYSYGKGDPDGTVVRVKVVYVGPGGSSPASNIGVLTWIAQVPPTAPTGVSASYVPGVGGVILTWDAPSDPTVTQVYIYRNDNGGGSFLLTNTDSGSTEFDDNDDYGAGGGSLPSGTYVYSVSFLNNGGEGPSADSNSVVVP